MDLSSGGGGIGSAIPGIDSRIRVLDARARRRRPRWGNDEAARPVDDDGDGTEDGCSLKRSRSDPPPKPRPPPRPRPRPLIPPPLIQRRRFSDAPPSELTKPSDWISRGLTRRERCGPPELIIQRGNTHPRISRSIPTERGKELKGRGRDVRFDSIKNKSYSRRNKLPYLP